MLVNKPVTFLVRCNKGDFLVARWSTDPDKAVKEYKKRPTGVFQSYAGIHPEGIVWREEMTNKSKAVSLMKCLNSQRQYTLKKLVSVKFRYLVDDIPHLQAVE